MRKSVASGADSLTVKPHLGALELEQAVDGGGVAARRLGEALGGAAGGGAEVHAGTFLAFRDLDKCAEDGRFARARAAGQDAELVGESALLHARRAGGRGTGSRPFPAPR